VTLERNSKYARRSENILRSIAANIAGDIYGQDLIKQKQRGAKKQRNKTLK